MTHSAGLVTQHPCTLDHPKRRKDVQQHTGRRRARYGTDPQRSRRRTLHIHPIHSFGRVGDRIEGCEMDDDGAQAWGRLNHESLEDILLCVHRVGQRVERYVCAFLACTCQRVVDTDRRITAVERTLSGRQRRLSMGPYWANTLWSSA